MNVPQQANPVMISNAFGFFPRPLFNSKDEASLG
jgi:hypothetical protein